MRQLLKMFEEVPDIVWWDRGAIVIGDREALESILPRYYRTSKFSSFQRQLNNFGYHRSYDRGNNWRGVCYCKVVGEPASTDINCLLGLRPLVRRTKKMLRGDDDHLVDSDHRVKRFATASKFDEDAPSLAHAAECLLSMNAACYA